MPEPSSETAELAELYTDAREIIHAALNTATATWVRDLPEAARASFDAALAVFSKAVEYGDTVVVVADSLFAVEDDGVTITPTVA